MNKDGERRCAPRGADADHPKRLQLVRDRRHVFQSNGLRNLHGVTSERCVWLGTGVFVRERFERAIPGNSLTPALPLLPSPLYCSSLLFGGVLARVHEISPCLPGSCWDEKCFRPKEYTERQLKITKWAMLVFCIIGGIGCVLVFSQGTEVSKGVTDFGDELVNTTKSLEVIINDWYAALVQASQEGSEDLADLQSSSVDISSSVVDLNDQIKGVAEKIELFSWSSLYRFHRSYHRDGFGMLSAGRPC